MDVGIFQFASHISQSESRVRASITLSLLLFSASHGTGQVKPSDQPLKRDRFPANIQQTRSSGVFVFT